MDRADEIALVFDTDLMRPACVMLQAAFGADMAKLGGLFKSESWLVAPTPGMRRIRGSRQEWKQLAERVNAIGYRNGDEGLVQAEPTLTKAPHLVLAPPSVGVR